MIIGAIDVAKMIAQSEFHSIHQSSWGLFSVTVD